MATMLYDQRTEGLVAVEVVAQEGDPMGRYRLGMFLQPAFARCSFTVLLGLPVLRHDVRRGQGKDLGLAGADDHGSNGGMIIEGLAIAELTGETVGAMHGFGGKVGGAIEGHQQLVTKDAKMRQHAMLFKALKDLNKHRIQGTWGDGIKQRADLIVTGNRLHTSEGMGVIVPLGVLQPALVFQKRWRLGEKDTKGTQGGLLDGVSGIGTLFAMVRQLRSLSVSDALEGIEV
jgi:hypothetical protein